MEISGLKSNLLTKKSYAISAVLKIFSLFSFIFFVQLRAVFAILCECVRTYRPVDLFLRKRRQKMKNILTKK